MNDPSLSDPELRDLASRLAAIAPPVSLAEQQQLLFASAFRAGRNSGIRTVRHWQAVAAGLVILAAGLTISRASQPARLAERSNAPTAFPRDVSRDRVVERTEDSAIRHANIANLDAWQLPEPEIDLSSESRPQHQPLDPRLQPFSVAALTRAYLEP